MLLNGLHFLISSTFFCWIICESGRVSISNGSGKILWESSGGNRLDWNEVFKARLTNFLNLRFDTNMFI